MCSPEFTAQRSEGDGGWGGGAGKKSSATLSPSLTEIRGPLWRVQLSLTRLPSSTLPIHQNKTGVRRAGEVAISSAHSCIAPAPASLRELW